MPRSYLEIDKVVSAELAKGHRGQQFDTAPLPSPPPV